MSDGDRGGGSSAAPVRWRLMVCCPLTHQLTFTGLVLTEQAAAQLTPRFFLCHSCGREHTWKPAEASLAPLPPPPLPRHHVLPAVDVPPVLPEQHPARSA